MYLQGYIRCGAILLTTILASCSGNAIEEQFDRLQSLPLPLAETTVHRRTMNEPLRPLPDVSAESLQTPVVNLGRSLFHDTRLSGDGSLSCASCHGIDQGGDDDLETATGIRGQKGPINTPTVLNSGFNFRQFWDGRAPNLHEQAKGPVTADIEMDANWDTVVATLSEDASLKDAFKTVFGSTEITQERVVHAIARFEESLITPAPFDEFLKGDLSAISAEASAGYEIFKAYGCASCHQGINVGGNLYQQFGVMQSVDVESFMRHGAKPVIRDREEDISMVKVPSLRNVELTAPYFHSGKINDLRTAVRIMGLSQVGRDIPDSDISLIVAFLESLTGNWQQHAALVK